MEYIWQQLELSTPAIPTPKSLQNEVDLKSQSRCLFRESYLCYMYLHVHALWHDFAAQKTGMKFSESHQQEDKTERNCAS